MTGHDLQLIALGVYLGFLLTALAHLLGQELDDRRAARAASGGTSVRDERGQSGAGFPPDPGEPVPYRLADGERP